MHFKRSSSESFSAEMFKIGFLLYWFYLIAKDRKMKEEFLFSNTLTSTTTGADVKSLVDSFLRPTSSASRISSSSVHTVPQR